MPASRAFSLPYAGRSVCTVALLLGTLASPSVSFGKQAPGTVTELAPGAGGRVWATTKTAGLFRSDDGAARWTWIEPIPGQQEEDSGLDSSWACGEIQAIATSATAPDIAYAATRKTVMRTEDGGVTWQSTGISKTIEMIAIAPGDPEVVYLSDRRRVWRTDDGGDTWRKTSAGVAGRVPSIYSLTVDPHDPLTVYAATGNGSFRSTDGGQSWVQGRGLSFVALVRIVVDPDDPAVLYGAERFRNVWKSVDQGLTWTRLAAFDDNLNLTDLEIDPFSPDALYLTANSGADGAPGRRPTGRVLRSLDRGATWTPVLTTELIHDLDFDPQQPGRIYVATDILGVFRSEDSGATWAPANQGLTAAQVFRLTPDSHDAGTLYAAVNPFRKETFDPHSLGIWKSVNDGASWSPIGEDVRDLLSQVADDQLCFLGAVSKDGSLNSNLTKITIVITPVNDPPTAGNDSYSVDEGGTLSQPAPGVLGGDTDPEGDPLAAVLNSGPAHASSFTLNANGSFSYTHDGSETPATDTFTYHANDGTDDSNVATVTITINPINDAPSFTKGPDQTIAEDAGPQTVNPWATAISAGPSGENGQTVTFQITGNANPTLFAAGPSISSTGVLTYTPAANTSGTATITVSVQDNGGTANGGVDTSAPQTFTITVNAVNDAPSFTKGPDQTNDEDAGPQTVNPWATAISAGPSSENGQTVSFLVTGNTNSGLFAAGPAISSAGVLTYTPAANTSGMATITVAAQDDGGTANGGVATSSPQTFTIIITPVNDPPVADNDAFDFIGNTELRVDLAPAATPHVLETTPTTFGVLDGDSDPEGDPITVSQITVGACTDNTPPFTCTVAGFGSITMDSNGRFSFVSEPGDTSATETFQYTVSDGQPINSTATATVTLTRFERVWYVKNDAPAGGLGRSSDPFDTLAEAQTASLANDYIFVYFGDGTTTGQSAGITLKNGQHLIGEHAGLSLPVNLNGNGAPTNLVAPAPGSRPLLDDTVAGGAQGVAATNLIPAEIVGLNLAGNVNGIDWTTSSTFAGTGTFSIRDNVIRSAANEGVDINLAGTTAVNLAFHDNTLTATGTGLDIQETGTGSLTITRFENNVVSGNTGGAGININTATFDSIPGGGINAVNGGMTVIGSAGNGVGGSGLVLSTMTGALNFNDLDIFADGGTGLVLSGTGVATTNLTVGAGVGQIAAVGGPAVNSSSATVDLQLSALQSTNSSTTGVSLNTVNGTVSAGSGSAITNASGTDFAISGGAANVTYAGTITDDVGLLVSVSGATAGTKSFTGAITDGNDGDGSGISLTSNTGATISFSGGVVLSTGANPALTATGGGTLRVTGSANTIATTTGRALNVANTTIHADGLTFRRISSNGAVNGIILNNTGTSGGLTVSGTGGAGTGGTIQNSTGNGISLTNARDIVLHSMVIDNNAGSGIFGDELTNFTIADSSVTNNATSAAEAGLRFNELLGTGAITNTTVSGSYQDNIRLTPASGVLTNLTITGSTIGPNPAGTGGNGLAIVSSGTADVTVTVSSTTFTGNQTNGFLATSTNTAQLDATLTSSTFTGNNIGIQLSNLLSSDLDFDISDNTFLNHASHAIFVTPGATATNAAAMVGTIAANSIGDGTADSGSRDGYGIRLDIRGDVTATVAVTGNTIRNTDLEGLFVESRLDNDADAEVGHLDLTLRDNDAGQPDNNSAFPLGAIYGTRVEARNTTVLCLDIAANDAESVGTFEDIQLRQRDTSTFRLERFAGNGAVDTSVEGFVTGENPLIDNADATHSVTFTGVADGFCVKP